jgi:hypothetical protein
MLPPVGRFLLAFSYVPTTRAPDADLTDHMLDKDEQPGTLGIEADGFVFVNDDEDEDAIDPDDLPDTDEEIEHPAFAYFRDEYPETNTRANDGDEDADRFRDGYVAGFETGVGHGDATTYPEAYLAGRRYEAAYIHERAVRLLREQHPELTEGEVEEWIRLAHPAINDGFIIPPLPTTVEAPPPPPAVVVGVQVVNEPPPLGWLTVVLLLILVLLFGFDVTGLLTPH